MAPSFPMMQMPHVAALAALALGATLIGCAANESRATTVDTLPKLAGNETAGDRQASVVGPTVPPPLQLAGSAYDAASVVELPKVEPGNYDGLHNVYRLSGQIISGSEPVDGEALSQLAEWGVKTILSVDGKVPDAETAEALGMRYVHVPIRYKGMSDGEIAKITKTFRELEGPFYVHCFHGKHRGPAAAAIGRVVIDGCDRDKAIAEMRQWSSTSKKYEGLYSAVATAEIPGPADTAKVEFDFASAHRFDGLRDAMIGMARTFDDVTLIQENGWRPDPAHPDVDPLQVATQLSQYYQACDGFEDRVDGAGDHYLQLMALGAENSDRLVQLLTACRTDGEIDGVALDEAYSGVKVSCSDCHTAYRNR